MESDESESDNSQSDQETDNPDNCLHCGDVHEAELEQEEEQQQQHQEAGLEQAALVESNRSAHTQLTHCNKAQTCDILDRNLYLRRMFVMPNSFLVSSPSTVYRSIWLEISLICSRSL